MRAKPLPPSTMAASKAGAKALALRLVKAIAFTWRRVCITIVRKDDKCAVSPKYGLVFWFVVPWSVRSSRYRSPMPYTGSARCATSISLAVNAIQLWGRFRISPPFCRNENIKNDIFYVLIIT